jgi:hypothetical protein
MALAAVDFASSRIEHISEYNLVETTDFIYPPSPNSPDTVWRIDFLSRITDTSYEHPGFSAIERYDAGVTSFKINSIYPFKNRKYFYLMHLLSSILHSLNCADAVCIILRYFPLQIGLRLSGQYKSHQSCKNSPSLVPLIFQNSFSLP